MSGFGYQWKNKQVGEAFDCLLNIFGGGDNFKFTNFMFLVRELDQKAWDGDLASIKLLGLLLQMQRFINAANKVDSSSQENSNDH